MRVGAGAVLGGVTGPLPADPRRRRVPPGRRPLGYDGKWVLHPGQLEVCNEVYSPRHQDVRPHRRPLPSNRRRAEVQPTSVMIRESFVPVPAEGNGCHVVMPADLTTDRPDWFTGLG
jgi:hypothetical protein